jgi:rRNA-processing protein FCF1|tara:strand:+ start:262 stop:645 length:384 start_codon:yes stop_codon:yes gene_type:complete
MEILLDTNFIITCAKQGIDFDAFVNGITSEEVKWIVPEEVLSELRGLRSGNKVRKKDLEAIDIGLKMIQKINVKVLRISDKNLDVDTKIVNYIKDKPIILATLDKLLKSRVDNRILTVRGKKKLEIF